MRHPRLTAIAVATFLAALVTGNPAFYTASVGSLSDLLTADTGEGERDER